MYNQSCFTNTSECVGGQNSGKRCTSSAGCPYGQCVVSGFCVSTPSGYLPCFHKYDCPTNSICDFGTHICLNTGEMCKAGFQCYYENSNNANCGSDLCICSPGTCIPQNTTTCPPHTTIPPTTTTIPPVTTIPPPTTCIPSYFGRTDLTGAAEDSCDSLFVLATSYDTDPVLGNGYIESISAMIGTISVNNLYRFGLYADNNGSPGALLGQSNVGNLIANTVNTAFLTSPIQVFAGTTYWIGFISNADTCLQFNNMFYILTPMMPRTAETMTFNFNDGFPDPYPNDVIFVNWIYVIAANYANSICTVPPRGRGNTCQ